MYFGTQYYRPPFPGPADWERDVKHIADTGFNIVKLWAVWSWSERRPGEFDFDDLERLVGLAETKGLKVVINLIPEGAPYWLERLHPDACYCGHDGRRLTFSGAANIPSGGWPGLCRDKPEVEALANRFLAAAASRFADSEAVIGFDVWNEPHIDPAFDYPDVLFCYCEHSRRKFAGWLQRKYGTVEALNRSWHRAYAGWEDVGPPVRFGTYPDMMDWRRFWLDNHADWLSSRVRAVQEAAPGKKAMTHVPFSGYLGQCAEGGLGQTLTDEFLLADRVEHFGLTSFPKWLMDNDFVQHLMHVELVAAAADGKPFWQTELQSGGGLWGIEGSPVATPEEIRLWNWHAIAGGATGVLYWQWRPEPSGLESPGFGLTALDGGPSERTEAAGDIARKLLSRVDFRGASRVPPVNGIYVSRTADLFAFAANRGERLYAQGLYGAYTSACEAGLPVRFIHGDHLPRALGEGLKVLYVPAAFALDEEERTSLKLFAEGGGKLVLEACAGMYDETGTIVSRSLVQELLGLAPLEVSVSDRVAWEWDAVDGSQASGIGARYRQDLTGASAEVEVFGHFEDGCPAAARKRCGAGEVVWVGTLPSVARVRFGAAAAGSFIASCLEAHAYEAIRVDRTEGQMVYRLLAAGEERFLVAVNRGETPAQIAYRWSDGRVRHRTVPPADGILVGRSSD
ncbi:beta-galactosidase [Cohnella nanjingensis]|uniref:beta-galactosidase n=1 Tax=Cohnella nanjingensis TaxID=1387779 RepID=A0A7X0RL29_9BACL|nr:beta-galactosidase [Cohnella nanjingensis]MBB6669453.1 beta-galactosidase [Cohnella nanjingensis]